MTIEVNNLTKIFGNQKALDNVSFSINTGEIVGLLGPNGAGKSTLMKILTCFIPPTFGDVKIYGLDIFENATEIKSLIGYLPEHNPLYVDLFVKEYLTFIAEIHNLKGKEKKQRVDDIIELVGLNKEVNKKINTLSKGYRQRIGLAQAMIHNPKVLILDEPTTGLDPNQLSEIRQIIKQTSKDRTVILSTHIMQEVEAVCTRALIINNGKLAADDSIENLKNNGSMENYFRYITTKNI